MSKSRSAYWFALVALLATISFDTDSAFAQTEGADLREVPTIFDVRKSLPMEPTEPVYHDFYINAGSEAGFKRGQYLPIQRALPVHDPIQNKQQAILTVPVGKVFVIHVDRGLTVARLVQELSGDERPTLDFEAIMIGDRVDMKGISTVAPKPSGKKRTDRRLIEATDVASKVETELDNRVAESPALSPAVAVQPSVQSLPAKPAQELKPAPSTVKSGATDAVSPPERVTQPVPPPTA
ncbi:MAG: hypothetical protein U1E10_14040 [Bdellovibrionales bacterium]|nr:hypothetical protein [Bdellovibrionales bacterium]